MFCHRAVTFIFMLSIVILFSIHFVFEKLEMSHFNNLIQSNIFLQQGVSNLIFFYIKGRNGFTDMLTWQSSHHPCIDCKERNKGRQLEWIDGWIHLGWQQVISFSNAHISSIFLWPLAFPACHPLIPSGIVTCCSWMSGLIFDFTECYYLICTNVERKKWLLKKGGHPLLKTSLIATHSITVKKTSSP